MTWNRTKCHTNPDFLVFLLFDFFSTFSSSESDEKTFLPTYLTRLGSWEITTTYNSILKLKDYRDFIQGKQTYFSRSARSLTMLSGSIPLLTRDSSLVSFSISCSVISFLGNDRGVKFFAHCLRRSFPSRTTLPGFTFC